RLQSFLHLAIAAVLLARLTTQHGSTRRRSGMHHQAMAAFSAGEYARQTVLRRAPIGPAPTGTGVELRLHPVKHVTVHDGLIVGATDPLSGVFLIATMYLTVAGAIEPRHASVVLIAQH